MSVLAVVHVCLADSINCMDCRISNFYFLPQFTFYYVIVILFRP